MKFLDLLRKLGIFRSGSVSATYKSGTDRPTEMMMENVFDAKKDLINKKNADRESESEKKQEQN